MLPDLIEHAIVRVQTFDVVRAVALVGSQAIDIRDPDADDWDVEAYTTTPTEPSEEQRRALWDSISPFDKPRAAVVGGRNDRFVVGDLHFGFSYFALDEVEQRLATVLKGRWEEGYYVPEAFAGKLSVCQPLWDPEGLVEGWRGQLSSYPKAFKLKALQELVFEARGDLQCLRRASELQDIPYFHVTLSDLCQRLLRLMFAVHDVWFRGTKRALRFLRSIPAVPGHWLTELESIAGAALTTSTLTQLAAQARGLLVQVAEFAVSQGPKEARAVRRGLSYWPDVDSLTVPSLAME